MNHGPFIFSAVNLGGGTCVTFANITDGLSNTARESGAIARWKSCPLEAEGRRFLKSTPFLFGASP